MDLKNAQVKITPDMIKNFKTFECVCGGKMFRSGLIFKKISSLVSPTGKAELYPIEVVICEKCGKVPTEFNVYDMLPDELLTEKPKI